MPSSSFKSLPTIETWVSASGPLPINVAPLNRSGHVAVLDQVRFGGGENEFAVGDVHLAAAKIHGVNSALHRANDVGGSSSPASM